MAQTLTGYIISKATNKRPKPSKSSRKEPKTLTGFLLDKFFNRENRLKKSFLGELQQEFSILGKKTENIKNISNYQINLHKDILLEEGDVASRMGRIQELLAERAQLETQYFEMALAKRAASIDVWTSPDYEIPKKIEEPEENQQNQKSENPDDIVKETTISLSKNPPKKQAAGGIQVNTSKPIKTQKQQIKLTQNFGKVMDLTMQTAGLSAITVIGDMLKAAGPISGFITPFIKSVIEPFAKSLGVSVDFVSRLLMSPARAEEVELYRRKTEFTKTWGKYLNNEDLISKYIDRTLTDDVLGTNEILPENLTGEIGEKSKQFAQYLMSKHGLSDFQAAAIVGVMLREGFGSGKPDVREGSQRGAPTYDGSSTEGYGWLQWTNTQGGGPNDRLNRALIHLGMGPPPKKTRPWTDMDNIKVMEYEWANHYTRTLPAVKKATTIEQAVYEFVGNYTAGSHANISTYQNRESKSGGGFIGRRNSSAAGVLKILRGADPKTTSLESGGRLDVTQGVPFGSAIVAGPESGFDTTISGAPVELHGIELVKQTPSGFQVFPLINRKFDIREDPEKVLDRWKSIASGTNTKIISPKAETGISVGLHELEKEEALSSLSRGKNDFIVKGGKSVISGTPWSKVTPKTPLYAYETGVSGDRTTIGWGMTFYDSITAGKKRVKPGDVISKAQADAGLKTLLVNYTKELSQMTWYKKYWRKMTPKQQGGLLMYGYNLPSHLLGTGAPKMFAALSRGDMVTVAANIDRGLPKREKIEKQLVLSGPRDLNKVPDRGPTSPPPKINTFTIPFTNIKIPYKAASASSAPVVAQTYDARQSDYEMYLMRLG